ncbi:uncharacterized protein LOC115968415 [Quercus lobata]|uniref:uncharacterized protein LOC115968415 n=1 Tax=Quercus lobata TaxID=97700 RepID=UPI00124698A2|nr:uncharacterized protein LOC115968415 [Quercus lobata]
MEEFGAALEECNLIDLGFCGYKFTWNNKRPGAANTRERLDRAVANKEWRDMFPTGTDNNFQGRIARGFKFEERWLLEEDCGNVVDEAWAQTGGADSPMAIVSAKINHCGAVLDAWGSSRTKPEVAEIKRLKKVLERLHNGVQNEATRSEFLAASK